MLSHSGILSRKIRIKENVIYILVVDNNKDYHKVTKDAGNYNVAFRGILFAQTLIVQWHGIFAQTASFCVD